MYQRIRSIRVVELLLIYKNVFYKNYLIKQASFILNETSLEVLISKIYAISETRNIQLENQLQVHKFN